ncbi:MAG: serine--tRNA ligase [Candidatus Aenigmarchaeota archaeon]|nr:serine--tRNA ligase [Candidatus Aenigmarchaeota archaeon]
MLDIKLIRENPTLVKKNLEKRHDSEKMHMLEELIRKDRQRLDVLKAVEALRKQRNIVTKDISEAKTKGKEIEKLAHQARTIPKQIKEQEEKLNSLVLEIDLLLAKLPNMLHDTVPTGKDDKDNKEIRRAGKKPKFSFQPKNHAEILEKLGMLDLERGAKVAGHGFYYLKGDAVMLDIALQRFALDFLRKKGFTVIGPPLMLNEEAFRGVTDWDTFSTQSYKIEGEDLRLIGTAEHPLGGMFKDEVLVQRDLPVLLAGVSACFRKEVGAHGKYTKGLFRVHHFNKVEQFVFCHPKDSWAWHEKIQQNAEQLYKQLGLHFRVVNVCTGDIGDIAAKKYDIEVWMADNVFREAGSNSNCTDYQTRNLHIKYREKEGQPPAGFVHTLNNTALATSRVMVALIEQNQKKDGSVAVPKALWEYTGFKKLG